MWLHEKHLYAVQRACMARLETLMEVSSVPQMHRSALQSRTTLTKNNARAKARSLCTFSFLTGYDPAHPSTDEQVHPAVFDKRGPQVSGGTSPGSRTRCCAPCVPPCRYLHWLPLHVLDDSSENIIRLPSTARPHTSLQGIPHTKNHTVHMLFAHVC